MPYLSKANTVATLCVVAEGDVQQPQQVQQLCFWRTLSPSAATSSHRRDSLISADTSAICQVTYQRHTSRRFARPELSRRSSQLLSRSRAWGLHVSDAQVKLDSSAGCTLFQKTVTSMPFELAGALDRVE